jgi:formylglycine-generating enzyme required for sulfatase activity
VRIARAPVTVAGWRAFVHSEAPVMNVSWYEAEAYPRWEGARLRGGSWASSRSARRRVSFRNRDLPARRQIFAGLRLAVTA